MIETNQKNFEMDLRNRIRGDVSFDEVTLGIYATDASIYQIIPIALCVPRDEEDVQAAVQTAAQYNVGILPRGGGTSLGGQAVGTSMVIDFTKYMNKILDLDVEQRWVRVQPGIVLDELIIHLAVANQLGHDTVEKMGGCAPARVGPGGGVSDHVDLGRIDHNRFGSLAHAALGLPAQDRVVLAGIATNHEE